MRQTEPAIEHVRDHLASARIPRLFTYFFDVHFLAEKGVKRFEAAALREMELAMRFAVLLADEVLVPAASYYENALCRKVLREYDPELFSSQIALVASGSSLDEFIEEKLLQYGPTQAQGQAYRAAGIQQAFPWYRRRRSATDDIRRDWRTGLQSGGMEEFFRTTRSHLPLDYERIFEALPERLGGAAFIVSNAVPLLFEGKTNIALTVENGLHAIVNQAYFGSYAQDLGAAVFQNMMFLQSPIPVPSGDPDRDVDFKRLVQACRLHGILADILKSPLELLHYLANDPRRIAASVEASGGVRRSELANYMLPMKPATRSYTIPPPASAINILIVTALPTETAAVLATFDEKHKLGVENDPHIYWEGTYHVAANPPVRRKVLLAAHSDMGKVNAATVAANALRSFPKIEHIIMVGIAGGCPNPAKPDEHVRLGDIVVSNDTGIVEYDDR